jgi:hypothetical protein
MSKRYEWVPIVAIWLSMVAFCFFVASSDPALVRGLAYDPDAEVQSTPPLKPRAGSAQTKE